MSAPTRTNYDVIIVGGAMYGAAVSWFLAGNPDFDGSILVVERDLTYSACSTAHTGSCIRQQFSSESNIRISQFGAEFIKNFREHAADARAPALRLQSFGYLYLADNEAFADALHQSHRVQRECGAATRLLSADEIAREYPFYQLDDIVLGSCNTVDEGYFDGASMFDWFRRAGRERGVEYLGDEVVAMKLNASGTRVESVALRSGATLGCGAVVNASGPRAARTARMAGIELPVEPRKRYTYVFAAQQPLDQDLPLTIDPSGVHVRTDGANYLAGCAPYDDRAVDYDDFEEDHDLWQDHVWPILANRIPQFEAVKLINSWAGHYAFNTFDQNAIIGAHTEVANFFFVNGFSGHGLQQSPAIGRGTAELITYGAYRSLDLSALNYDRITRNEPLIEKAVI